MHPYLDAPRPHLFAHRGASGEYPENTLPAFDRAVELGIQFLEMDCHASRDGEIVICHDAALERTTEGEGLVREHAWAELARLDAGFRFESADGGTPFRDRGIRLPRLEEVLARYPEARINLEVKQAEPPIASDVVHLIRQAKAESRVLLAAEDDAILGALRELDSGTALGSSIADALAFFGALDAGEIEGFTPRGHALQIPPSFDDRDLVTPESVGAARRVGLALHVWTINDPDEIDRLLALGVDGVMSDFPARLLRAAAR